MADVKNNSEFGEQYVKLRDMGDGTYAQVIATASDAGTLTLGRGLSASVSVTRPSNTNTYGAGDVVGTASAATTCMSFALGAISGSNILITSVAFERDVVALILGEAGYTLHLYNIAQPSAQVDEATWDLPSGDRASYLGFIDLGTPVDMGSTLYVEQTEVNKQVKLEGTGIFGILVTVGGYIAASASVHKVTINAVQL